MNFGHNFDVTRLRSSCFLTISYGFSFPVILLCSIFGCSGKPLAFSETQASFVVEPAIELDPHLSAPLAALLTFKTNIPTRVSLHLNSTNSDKNHTLTINFRQFRTEHELPVLGIRSDTQYMISLKAYREADNIPALEHTLTFSTDPLPEDFPSIVLKKRIAEKTEPGLTLFNVIPEGDNTEFGEVAVVVDEDGEVIWYQVGTRYTDLRQLHNHNFIFIDGAQVVEMNGLGESVNEWQATQNRPKNSGPRIVNTPIFHHEIYPMKTGNFLSLSIEVRQFDNYRTSLKYPDAPTEKSNVVGDRIVEFRPDGSIYKQWSLLKMLDPYRLGFDSLNGYWDQFVLKKTRDWSHSNSVIYSEKDNSIIVTSRHQDATIKFKRSTGELLWILAPHENWNMEKYGKYLLKPANGRKYFFPYHAHAPMIMPNGNLLLYDNGNYRASPFGTQLPDEQNFSRVVEYAIDEQSKQVELVWEYGEFINNRIYSAALGDADYLPESGNILITHGNIYGYLGKLSARILEVTHTTPSEEVFQLDVFDATSNTNSGWRIYRASRIKSLYADDMLLPVEE